MKIRSYTTFGFQCPVCGNVELKRLNSFDFSGRTAKGILCGSCHREIASLHNLGGGKYKFLLQCVECGQKHSYTVNISDFWHTDMKVFRCPGFDEFSAVIGSENNVKQTLRAELCTGEANTARGRSDEISDSLSDMGFSSCDVMDIIHHFEFLSQNGRIQCKCGEQLLQLQIETNGVSLCCPACGREAFYDISTPDNLSRVLSLNDIYLE